MEKRLRRAVTGAYVWCAHLPPPWPQNCSSSSCIHFRPPSVSQVRSQHRAITHRQGFQVEVARPSATRNSLDTCDLGHILLITNARDSERLIVSTAFARELRFSWSALRFELDTYHGDALPTELTGLVARTEHSALGRCPYLQFRPRAVLHQVS